MAFQSIPNNSDWEYDNTPPDPGGKQSDLWNKQVNGIRVNSGGDEVYSHCRKIGTGVQTSGELNKSYWDNQRITFNVTGGSGESVHVAN